MRQIRCAIWAVALFSGMSTQGAIAQHAGGIAICLAACAKSDKPCQDRCIPGRSLQDTAKACIADCRDKVVGRDFMVEMRQCIAGCLGESSATQ
jgi:hypothetical protein